MFRSIFTVRVALLVTGALIVVASLVPAMQSKIELFELSVCLIAGLMLAIKGLRTPPEVSCSEDGVRLFVIFGGLSGLLLSLNLDLFLRDEWFFYKQVQILLIFGALSLLIADIWLPWFVRATNWGVSHRLVAVICLTLACIFSFALAKHDVNRPKAYFGGDIWSYQALAVNWALGHGLRDGRIEEFSVYQFDTDPEGQTDRHRSFRQGATPQEPMKFDREPGYPVFLGIIYRAGGISPILAKQVQYIILGISCALLPIIGLYFWHGLVGLVTGVLGSAIVFFYYAEGVRLADKLMTELIQVCTLILLTVLFITWEKRPTMFKSCLFGCGLGVSLLVKTSLIFLPVLFLCYGMWRLTIRSIPKKSSLMTTALVFCLLVVGAWSVYASIGSGEAVFLSSRGSITLPAGNNEYSFVSDDAFSEEWRNDDTSFYNQPDMQDKPVPIQVLLFWKKYWPQIPGLFHKKLSGAFDSPALYVTVLFYILESLLILGRLLKVTYRRVFLSFSITAVGVGVLMWGPFVSGISGSHYGSFYLYICGLLFFLRLWKGCIEPTLLPTPMVLMFLNFAGLTILTFAEFRYVVVVEWVFVLTALSYLITHFLKLATFLENHINSYGVMGR